MRLLLLTIVACAASCARSAQSFFDTFLVNRTDLWNYTNDIMQQPPFRALPTHVHLNHSLDGHPQPGVRGLLLTMDTDPCATNPPECCIGSHCATIASGHLQGMIPVQYGYLEVFMRTAFSDDGGPPPDNGFMCISTYTHEPVWDEIDMCFYANTGQLDSAAFVNGKETKLPVNLGFDPSQSWHLYSFEWTPQSIVWKVDGRVVQTLTNDPILAATAAAVTGAPVTIGAVPSHAQTVRVILRPFTSGTFTGDARAEISHILFNASSAAM